MLAATLAPEAASAPRKHPTIGIATSWWGSYDAYLPEWRAGIDAQIVQPDEVVVHHVTHYTSMGKARNEAIEQLSTDWVIYADADDIILPNAIADSVPHLHTSDVVVWNYRELGGPHDGQVRQFKNSGSLAALRNTAVAMSLAPFRRSLWQESPYLEIPSTKGSTNGAVDAFLWVQFHSLGAIFRNLQGVQFVYRKHSDSESSSWLEGWGKQSQAFNEFLAAGLTGRDQNRRLQNVPIWVRNEVKALAREWGVDEADVWEYAWRSFKDRPNVL